MQDTSSTYDRDPVETIHGVPRFLGLARQRLEPAIDDLLLIRDMLEAPDISLSIEHPGFVGEVTGIRGLVEAARHYAELREEQALQDADDWAAHEKGD